MSKVNSETSDQNPSRKNQVLTGPRRLSVAARTCAPGLALWMVLAPVVQAQGLGIGEPSRVSGLLEPLKVEIPLQLDGLPPEDVRVELGLDTVESDAGGRPSGAAALRREIVVDAAGQALLRVSSGDRVREPILHLRVDLSGAGIRVRRELTLLFDPPASSQSAATGVVQSKKTAAAAPNDASKTASKPDAVKPGAGAAGASRAAGRAPAAARTKAPSSRALPPPRDAGSRMRLYEKLSSKPAKGDALVSAPAVVAPSPLQLKMAESLSPASLAYARAVPVVAATDGAPTSAAALPVGTVDNAAPVTAATAQGGEAVAATGGEVPDGGGATSPVAAAAPAKLAAPAARPKDEKDAPLPMGLLLGLLAVAALGFGWLFRSLRRTRARRGARLMGQPGQEAAAWASDHEMRDTLLELGRPVTPPPAPVPRTITPSQPLHTRDAVTVEYIDSPELTPEPEPSTPAVDEAARKPLQAFPDEWSPDDFDLSQPLEDKRPGRR